MWVALAQWLDQVAQNDRLAVGLGLAMVTGLVLMFLGRVVEDMTYSLWFLVLAVPGVALFFGTMITVALAILTRTSIYVFTGV